MEELEKVSKELKRSATLSVEQHYELTSTPELLTLALVFNHYCMSATPNTYIVNYLDVETGLIISTQVLIDTEVVAHSQLLDGSQGPQ